MIKSLMDHKYDLNAISSEIEFIIKNIGWSTNEKNQIMIQGTKEGLGSLEWKKEIEHLELNIPDNFVISKFIRDHNLCRTRLLKIPQKSCYSYHMDGFKRVHLAVYTNVNCFFVIEDNIYRIPSDGFAYLVDTTKLHTFVNSDKKLERIHLVGSTALW